MIAYAESSAVLAWVLGEPEAEEVRTVLAAAERVVSSTLTGVECARALARGAATGRLGRTDELAAARLLEGAMASWAALEISGRILRRAATRFPFEPVPTLDALHLATALSFREADPDLILVSLDDRLRANAQPLGSSLVLSSCSPSTRRNEGPTPSVRSRGPEAAVSRRDRLRYPQSRIRVKKGLCSMIRPRSKSKGPGRMRSPSSTPSPNSKVTRRSGLLQTRCGTPAEAPSTPPSDSRGKRGSGGAAEAPGTREGSTRIWGTAEGASGRIRERGRRIGHDPGAAQSTPGKGIP
jgi:predicted nucleic acid-binding protein